MKNTVDLLTICFKNEILASEIPLFRGAVIHAIQDKADVLFHNHVGQSFRYAYPLIQYKRIRKKAAIVCLKQGTEIRNGLRRQDVFSARTVLQKGIDPLPAPVEHRNAEPFRLHVQNKIFPHDGQSDHADIRFSLFRHFASPSGSVCFETI